MVTETPKNLVPKFFNETATTYDRVVRWTTFGRDAYWKNEILKKITSGNSFLDLACGTGILTRKIATKFPNASIVGVDVTKSYLELAKKNSAHLKNITYIHKDAEQLRLDAKFDCIASSYIPKYCDPNTLVDVCLEHLKPQGKILLHDFTYPIKSVRKLWDAYFVLLGLVGHFVPSWKDAFVELPKLIRSSDWPAAYKEAMQERGLETQEMYLTWKTSLILVGTKV